LLDNSRLNKRISKVAVLGSGLMGTGIAAQLADCGLEVLLLDRLTDMATEKLDEWLAEVERELAEAENEEMGHS